MASEILYIDNDIRLTVDGVRDEGANTYINDATVNLTLLDSSGNEVAGESWPVTLSYVAASNGQYQTILSNALPLVNRAEYTARIEIDGGATLVASYDRRALAIRRS